MVSKNCELHLTSFLGFLLSSDKARCRSDLNCEMVEFGQEACALTHLTYSLSEKCFLMKIQSTFSTAGWFFWLDSGLLFERLCS